MNGHIHNLFVMSMAMMEIIQRAWAAGFEGDQ
jgi:hypothetical protein